MRLFARKRKMRERIRQVWEEGQRLGTAMAETISRRKVKEPERERESAFAA